VKLLKGRQAVRDALREYEGHPDASRHEFIVIIAEVVTMDVLGDNDEDVTKFSMTIEKAEKADDDAVAAAPLLFEVDRPGELKRWIETNELKERWIEVPLETFIKMFKKDGTILSSKKFRNSKFRAPWRNSCIIISSGFDSISRMSISMNQ
jgi:hypothetical protein